MTALKLLNQAISSDRFDAQLGQRVAFGVSLLVLILGLFKVTSMALTEYELFSGILLVGAVSLLCAILGLLLPIAETCNRTREQNRQQG